MYRQISVLIVCALGLNSAAHADAAPDVRQLLVNFAELDLARVEGAAAVYRRLHAAAETVCGPAEERDLLRAAAIDQCVRAATARAVLGINQPTLTAYYRALRQEPTKVARATR